MFVMLVSGHESYDSHWGQFEITKGGLEPPEPNANYAPVIMTTEYVACEVIK